MTNSRLIVIVLIGIFTILEANLVFGSDVPNELSFNVVICSFEKSLEYVIKIPTNEVIVLTSKKPSENEAKDCFRRVVSSLVATENERKHTAASLDNQFSSAIKWASFSFDRQYVLVGYEDPKLQVMSSADIIRISDFKIVKRFKSKDGLDDLQWSPTSNVLAILETTRITETSFKGLLATILSHPIVLSTFYLRVFDLNLSTEQRVTIAADIKNPAAMMTTGSK